MITLVLMQAIKFKIPIPEILPHLNLDKDSDIIKLNDSNFFQIGNILASLINPITKEEIVKDIEYIQDTILLGKVELFNNLIHNIWEQRIYLIDRLCLIQQSLNDFLKYYQGNLNQQNKIQDILNIIFIQRWSEKQKNYLLMLLNVAQQKNILIINETLDALNYSNARFEFQCADHFIKKLENQISFPLIQRSYLNMNEQELIHHFLNKILVEGNVNQLHFSDKVKQKLLKYAKLNDPIAKQIKELTQKIIPNVDQKQNKELNKFKKKSITKQLGSIFLMQLVNLNLILPQLIVDLKYQSLNKIVFEPSIQLLENIATMDEMRDEIKTTRLEDFLNKKIKDPKQYKLYLSQKFGYITQINQVKNLYLMIKRIYLNQENVSQTLNIVMKQHSVIQFIKDLKRKCQQAKSDSIFNELTQILFALDEQFGIKITENEMLSI